MSQCADLFVDIGRSFLALPLDPLSCKELVARMKRRKRVMTRRKIPNPVSRKGGPSDEGLKGVHVRMLVPISYDAKLAVILKSVFSRPRMDSLPQAKRQVTVVLFRRKDLHKTRD